MFVKKIKLKYNHLLHFQLHTLVGYFSAAFWLIAECKSDWMEDDCKQ